MKPHALRRPSRALSLPWAWTLCLALMLRALVPAGTMFDFDVRGGFFPGLTLCPTQNPGLTAGHHHSEEPPQSHASPVCLLAQQAGSPPLPMVASAQIPAVVVRVIGMPPPVVSAPVQRVRGAPVGLRAPPRPFI